MKRQFIIVVIAGVLLSFAQSTIGQQAEISPVKSITEAELRDHIFFLASDYMGGRIGPSVS